MASDTPGSADKSPPITLSVKSSCFYAWKRYKTKQCDDYTC